MMKFVEKVLAETNTFSSEKDQDKENIPALTGMFSLLIGYLLVDDLLFGKGLLSVGDEVASLAGLFLLQELPVPFVGYDHGHHFVAAGPDGGQADGAADPLYGQDVGVADPAQHLHGVVDHLLA